MKILVPSKFVGQLSNSLLISLTLTFLAVSLGLLAVYAFSRYDIPGKGGRAFFILSTRMLPPIVVTIPIFLTYRALGMYDTHIGLILLYTVFNLSFAVWLLKGFIDEIPIEYEEAGAGRRLQPPAGIPQDCAAPMCDRDCGDRRLLPDLSPGTSSRSRSC